MTRISAHNFFLSGYDFLPNKVNYITEKEVTR